MSGLPPDFHIIFREAIVIHIRFVAAIAATLASLCSVPSFGADKVVLVTEDEASRPAQTTSGLDRRGITRGPQITLVDPAQVTEALKSPLHLLIKFESRGGASIDPSTVKVTYMKAPPVDLTDRVKPFLQNNSIDIGQAELPAGNHLIRIDVKDSEGHLATSVLNLTIAK